MPIYPPLPDTLLITPEPPEPARFDLFLERLDRALASGIGLVQLRAKTLDAAAYRDLARQASMLCRRHAARIVLNAPLENLLDLDADGLHLPSARLMRLTSRPPMGPLLLSAACHSRVQLLHAQAIGVDFVTLSPVLPTTSHPGEPPLGWREFQALVAQISLPVYALGGMTGALRATALAHGAHGVAGISAFW